MSAEESERAALRVTEREAGHLEVLLHRVETERDRLAAELARARAEARDAGERLDSYRYVDSRIVRRVHEAHRQMHADGKLDHTFNAIGGGCPMCVAEKQGYDDQERYDLRLVEVTADRDRLAGIVAEIADYCQHVADAAMNNTFDVGRQWTAEAVLDIIKGEA